MPKAHATKSDKRIKDMREEFLKDAEKLWKKHEARFMSILDDSEDNKISLTFRALLDFSESTALLSTQFRFSEVFTDEVTGKFDDPAQPKLPGMGKAQATEEHEAD